MNSDDASGRIIVFIAGYRYAGKSLILQELERSGYRCVDNLPFALAGDYLGRHRVAGRRHGRKIALSLDEGTLGEEGSTARDLIAFRDRLAAEGDRAVLVFLSAGDTALAEREASAAARAGCPEEPPADPSRRDAERSRFSGFLEDSDLVLDTSYAAPGDLRERILSLAEGGISRPRPVVDIASFGFKYGALSGDLVLDARFLPNPYYVAELRPLSGKDPACSDYVLSHPGAQGILEGLGALIRAMEPSYQRQGRYRLRVRIGCTGGHHRSVALAEALGAVLSGEGYTVSVRHRDLVGQGARDSGERDG